MTIPSIPDSIRQDFRMGLRPARATEGSEDIEKLRREANREIDKCLRRIDEGLKMLEDIERMDRESRKSLERIDKELRMMEIEVQRMIKGLEENQDQINRRRSIKK
jgi:hypothetical protein